MTMCLGKEKLEHIISCRICQQRLNAVLQGIRPNQAVKRFKKQKNPVKEINRIAAEIMGG